MANIDYLSRALDSRKPAEMYGVIESCSYGPYIELFSRTNREGWTMWGNQAGLLEADDSLYEYGYRLDRPEEQMKLLQRRAGYTGRSKA